MVENKLEKRMYFLVPYNISSIQQGIQPIHAALRYARKYAETDPAVWDFVDNHETVIVLNGGTTNCKYEDGNDYPNGTLDQDRVKLMEHDIKHVVFHEPDLNDALAAICLLVDERVFNRKDYPDFDAWFADKVINEVRGVDIGVSVELIRDVEYETYKKEVGEDIAFLKELLNTKKLA